MPLVNQIYEAKKKKLGLDTLRPWDVEAEPAGIQPLRPFKTGEELTEKTIACFDELSTGPDGKSFFGDCLRKMKELGHLDLESRKGKAPVSYTHLTLPTSDLV